MKKILIALALLVSGMYSEAAKADLIYRPNFGIGVGVHDNTGESEDRNLYGVAKIYFLEVPGSGLSLNLLGAGASLDTSGEAQFVVSPLSLSILNFISIAPDYGFGLGDSHDKIGFSISLGF